MSFTKVKPIESRQSASLALLERLAGQALPQAQDLAPVLVCLSPEAALFEAGQAHPFVYVVREGLLKLHYLQADGQEWIKSFSAEGMFFGSLSALQPGGRSSFAVTAIEASLLERIDYRRLEQLAAAHPPWLLALYRAMQHFAALKESRERELLTLTPPERYAAFLAEAPQLAERIPLKDMARYLGVTPVSLSRIRRRLKA